MNELYCNEPKQACPDLIAVKEPGMFVEVADTINVLMDISEKLMCFSREIGVDMPEEKRGGINPTSFHESIRLTHMLALGLNHDLDKLLAQFR